MFRKMMLIAPFIGAATLSTGAEVPGKSTASVQPGIRMSEWGRETRLSELTSSARTEIGDEVELPDFGEFLSEEWNTLGAEATSAESLRKMLANRAIGRKDDSLLSFMSSRWKSAPGRLANFLTDYGEARLNALPGVENAALEFAPDGENGFGFSASGVGVVRRTESSAFGIQPRLEKSGVDGRLSGSFGAFQRHGIGEAAVIGVNAFVDYASDPVHGELSRWRVGADFASAWADADVKHYFGGSKQRYRRDGRLFRSYVPDGTTAELRLHSPDFRWLEGYAKFAEWQGRGGKPDKRSQSYGLTFSPYRGALAGWRASAELADAVAGFRLAYDYALGKPALPPAATSPFGVYTSITDPVDPGQPLNLEQFEVYEFIAWREGWVGNFLYHRPSQEWRYSRAAWSKIEPSYMRVSGEWQDYTVPPIFPILDYSANSIWREGVLSSGDNGLDPQEVANGAIIGKNVNKMMDSYGDMHPLHAYFHGHDFDLHVNSWSICRGYPEYSSIPEDRQINCYDEGPYWDYVENAVKILIIAGSRVNDVEDGITPLRRLDLLYNGGYRDEVGEDGVTIRSPLMASTAERMKETARVLRANHAHCGGASGPLCDIALPTGYTPYVRQLPPPGALLEAEIKKLPQGYTGEAFRITAETAYADVDYALLNAEDLFSVTVAGAFKYRENWRGHRTETMRKEISGNTKVAVVHMTSAAPPGNHIVTLWANFFYHANHSNREAVTLTVQVMASPALQTIDVTIGHTGPFFHFGYAGYENGVFVGATFSGVGESEKLDVSPSGIASINQTLAPSDDASITVEAVSDQFMGTIRITLSVLQIPDPAAILYIASPFNGEAHDFATEEFGDGLFVGGGFQFPVLDQGLQTTPQGMVSTDAGRLPPENAADALPDDQKVRRNRTTRTMAAIAITNASTPVLSRSGVEPPTGTIHPRENIGINGQKIGIN